MNRFRPGVSSQWAASILVVLLREGYISARTLSANSGSRKSLSQAVARPLATLLGLRQARREEIRAVVDQAILQNGFGLPLSDSGNQCGGLTVNVDSFNVNVSGFCSDANCVKGDSAVGKALEIKTVTFVNGCDVSKLSNDQVLDMITSESERIAKLEALPVKPVTLKKEIDERKAGIQALVDHIDAVNTKAETAAAPTA